MKTGRNDPCPCGSGKKYQKCCANRSEPPILQDMKEDISSLIADRNFESMEELQAALDQYNRQQNNAPREEFHGLSPEEMHCFLHKPLESSELVTFSQVLQTEPESKAAFILSMLVEEIGEDGTKLTAKGNLGQKFCQEASKKYFARYPDSMMSRLTVQSETNFEPLHAVRLTAQLGGLLRKYKGRLLLTKKCRKALEHNGLLELYPLLIQAYIQKFNWGYRDGYQELPFVQQSFLFTLYLLHKYGNSWRPATFYNDNYLQAFPMILQEIESKPCEPPEDTLRNCYSLRTLQRFAGFFGLAHIEQVSREPINREYRVRATELLDEMIHFHLEL